MSKKKRLIQVASEKRWDTFARGGKRGIADFMACHQTIDTTYSVIVHVENPVEYYSFVPLKKKEET